jgi:hypothetical protein
MGKPEGKGQLGRYKHRRDNSIKIGLRDEQWYSMCWIHVAQGMDQ